MNAELRQYTGNLEAMVRQRLAEQEESDLRFKELYDNVLDILLLIDPAGVIQMVNRHGAALLGSTPEALQGRWIDEFLSGDCRDRIDAEVLTPLRREGTVRGVQMRLVVRGGRTIEVETSGNSVRMPDSGEQYQLILRDITATKTMERQVLESERQFADSRQVAILGLARLAESRDDATGAHLLRIREYTRILATELARDPEFMDLLPDAFIEDLCLSSILHDIGKVGIADAVLLKAGKLTEAEFAAMRNHCEYGGAALSSAEGDAATLSFLRTGQQITRYHHENWDGSGYPHGLAGLDIPLAARIVALADVYDALTSSRPYKPAFPHAQARETIAAGSGRRFDPAMVRAFLRCEARLEATRNALQPTSGSGRS
jgi:PAS domain S-box-containing protein